MNELWILSVLLVGAGGVLFHTYVGYPLLMQWLAHRFPAPVLQREQTQPCSMVIAAYNEVETLPGKLRAFLDSDNAPWIDQILVGSDGSDDGTEAAVEALGDGRIRVIRFEKRRGKPAVLNDLIPRCQHGVVILTDARQEIAPGAVAHLMRNFADPSVGVVSGELIFRSASSATAAGADNTAAGMNAYWNYEKWIRRAEARFRSVPGATGALYAIRCEEFRPIPEEILLDDVAIPMQIVCRGLRCVFEPRAIVYDVPSTSARAEAVRKRRTIAGNFQLAMRMPELLWPGTNPIWFEFMSHKMLRLLSPLCLLLLSVASVAGWVVVWRQCPHWTPWHGFFGGVAAAQLGFYLLAAWGAWGNRSGCRWAKAAALFVQLNAVTCLAWVDACGKRFRVDWQRSTTDLS